MKPKLDLITIGSATRDVFVKSREFKILRTPQFSTGRALAVSLGSKLNVDELQFFVGGGAVNTAVTFANQGLRVAALAVVGKDPGGKQIISFLKEHRIRTDFVFVDGHDRTSYSLILTAGIKDRTILNYKGVMWHLPEFQIPWQKLTQTKWFYINHLGEKSHSLLPKLISAAKKHRIRIAFNPGRTQLEHRKELLPLLKYIDVFILNQEEASQFTGVPYQNREKIFDVLDKSVKGIAVMTRGPKGVEVSDGKTRWSTGVLPLKKIVDRTGAGDAFGSGFVAALMRKPSDIAYAMQFASANATGVLREWGANHGLLQKGDSITKWRKLKIKKTIL